MGKLSLLHELNRKAGHCSERSILAAAFGIKDSSGST
jgi:hypothetical protein